MRETPPRRAARRAAADQRRVRRTRRTGRRRPESLGSFQSLRYFAHAFSRGPALSPVKHPARLRTDTDGEHAPVAYWVENVNNREFKACFRQSAVGTSSGKADDKPVYFNWVALTHRNPDLWYAGAVPPYAAAGTVAAGKWSPYARKQPSSSSAPAGSGRLTHLSCEHF